MNEEAQQQFKAIIDQMALVYKHDSRPWMIGYSGGKDSTLLCQLTFEMLESLAPEERNQESLYRNFRHNGRKPHCKEVYA